VPSSAENPASERGRALLLTLFAIYLLLLAWIVLWKLQVPYTGGGALRELKLVPFLPTAGAGGSRPAEVLANLALFVPFGLYLGLLKRRWRWWMVGAIVAASSLLLEVAQYLLAVGRSDVTDLVVNTAGGLIGMGILALVGRRLKARTVPVMTRICSIATVLGLLASAIFIASPVRFAQPRDNAAVFTNGASGPAVALSASQ
jgi:glycopeptide antibiotics resistance protein